MNAERLPQEHLAKLAAIYGLGDGDEPPRRVRIITIDNYRIAAKQQIETYAEIMRIPVSLVESAEDLRKNIALYQDTDLILVDTIGRSPRDLGKLAEMKESWRPAEAVQRLPGPVGHDQGQRHRGDPPAVCPVRVPRGDPHEARRDDADRQRAFLPGPAAHSRAYLCDGQGVPQDLEEATAVRLLMNMEGFRIDREALEEKFNAVTAEAAASGTTASSRKAAGGAEPARPAASATRPGEVAALDAQEGDLKWETRRKS